MSTHFWKQKVCWQCPAMFCLYTSSILSLPWFEFSLWRWWDQIQVSFKIVSTSCKMSIFVHSSGLSVQNWVKFGPRSCWMTPVLAEIDVKIVTAWALLPKLCVIIFSSLCLWYNTSQSKSLWNIRVFLLTKWPSTLLLKPRICVLFWNTIFSKFRVKLVNKRCTL